MDHESAQARQLLQASIEHARFVDLVLSMQQTCYTSNDVEVIVDNHLAGLRTRLVVALNLFASVPPIC